MITQDGTTADTALLDTARQLAEAYPVAAADLDRLHGRLVSAAEAGATLDVSYRVLDTPVGSLLLAGTELGLVRVAFAIEDHQAVLQELSDRISPRILRAPARLEAAVRQLDGYFAGQRRRFELALDWRLSRGFRRTVLGHLTDIGYGHTASYAGLAELAGNPKAVRAVGTACATNPLPVVVPCHRVVRADGSMGSYRGGVEAKRVLLSLEAAG